MHAHIDLCKMIKEDKLEYFNISSIKANPAAETPKKIKL